MKSLTCLLFFVSLFSFQSFFSSEVSDLQARIAKLEQNIAELQPQKKSDKFSMQNKDMYAVFGGKYTQEMFGASNLNFLNGDVINDSAFFLRSTMDYFMDLGYGEYGKPRILAHNTFRFRYKWGTTTEVKVQDASLDILDTNFSIKGTQVNKHLLWSRGG